MSALLSIISDYDLFILYLSNPLTSLLSSSASLSMSLCTIVLRRAGEYHYICHILYIFVQHHPFSLSTISQIYFLSNSAMTMETTLAALTVAGAMMLV
mmetsp:Transcript_22961/g.35915  ORF Transcript_22961/g.35915 Transcript_22961/m.35915 type:complete len:98 (-) Transcript_22961:204-497(-)